MGQALVDRIHHDHGGSIAAVGDVVADHDAVAAGIGQSGLSGSLQLGQALDAAAAHIDHVNGSAGQIQIVAGRSLGIGGGEAVVTAVTLGVGIVGRYLVIIGPAEDHVVGRTHALAVGDQLVLELDGVLRSTLNGEEALAAAEAGIIPAGTGTIQQDHLLGIQTHRVTHGIGRLRVTADGHHNGIHSTVAGIGGGIQDRTHVRRVHNRLAHAADEDGGHTVAAAVVADVQRDGHVGLTAPQSDDVVQACDLRHAVQSDLLLIAGIDHRHAGGTGIVVDHAVGPDGAAVIGIHHAVVDEVVVVEAVGIVQRARVVVGGIAGNGTQLVQTVAVGADGIEAGLQISTGGQHDLTLVTVLCVVHLVHVAIADTAGGGVLIGRNVDHLAGRHLALGVDHAHLHGVGAVGLIGDDAVQLLTLSQPHAAAAGGHGGGELLAAVRSGVVQHQEAGIAVLVVGTAVHTQLAGKVPVDAARIGDGIGLVVAGVHVKGSDGADIVSPLFLHGRGLDGVEALGHFGGTSHRFSAAVAVLVGANGHAQQEHDLVTVHIDAAAVVVLVVSAVGVLGHGIDAAQQIHGIVQIEGDTVLLLVADHGLIGSQIDGVILAVVHVGNIVDQRAHAAVICEIVVRKTKVHVLLAAHGNGQHTVHVGAGLGDGTGHALGLGQNVLPLNVNKGNDVIHGDIGVFRHNVVALGVVQTGLHAGEHDVLVVHGLVDDGHAGGGHGNGSDVGHDLTVGNDVSTLSRGRTLGVVDDSHVVAELLGGHIAAVEQDAVLCHVIVLGEHALVFLLGVDCLGHDDGIGLVHDSIDPTGLGIILISLAIIDGNVVTQHIHAGLDVEIFLVAVGQSQHGSFLTGRLIGGHEALGDLQLIDLTGQGILAHHFRDLGGIVAGGTQSVAHVVEHEGNAVHHVAGRALAAVLQTLQRDDSQLIADQGVVGGGSGIQITKQLHLGRLGHNGQRPLALTGVHLQGVDDHSDRFGSGHGLAGLEGAVAVALDYAQLEAGVDVALGPAALKGSGVGKGIGRPLKGVGIEIRAIQHLHDDGGHLGTGNGALGHKFTVRTGKQTHTRGNGDRLLVDDLVRIGKLGRRRGHHHHADQHDQCQHHGKNAVQVFHVCFLLKYALSGYVPTGKRRTKKNDKPLFSSQFAAGHTINCLIAYNILFRL